jgi:fucose permease
LVLLIALVFVFYVGAEVGFGGWIYTYAISLELTDTVGAAYLTSLFWGSLTAGRLLGIAIATRFRPVIIMLSDLIGCLLSLGLIWVLPRSQAAVWGGSIGLGLFMASIFPSLLAFAEHRLTMSGAITRWFFVGTGVGGMLFPWLLGVLIESRGPFAIIPALFLLMTLALFAFLACKVLAEK